MSKKRSKARRTNAKPALQPAQAREQVAAVAMASEAAETTERPDEAAVVAAFDVVDVEPAESMVDAGMSSDAGTTAPLEADDHAEPQAEAPLHHEPVSAPVAMPAADAHPETRFAPFDDPGAIRGVLIQVAGGRLLLPNATIAEVLSYAEPDPVGGDAPDWLLGRMRWRGWQLPLVAFSQLAGVGTERAGLGTKVVVLKALGGQGKTPYFAILTQGFPRLVTVSQSALEAQGGEDTLPRGIQARVRLNQDDALLPDLESIEGLIVGALAQAA